MRCSSLVEMCGQNTKWKNNKMGMKFEYGMRKYFSEIQGDIFCGLEYSWMFLGFSCRLLQT